MLFTLSFLAAAALAAPLEKNLKVHVLPLTHHNSITNVKNLVENGQARLRGLNGPSKFKVQVGSGSATNEDVSYVATVSIGGKPYSLIVDTGCKSLTEANVCKLTWNHSVKHLVWCSIKMRTISDR